MGFQHSKYLRRNRKAKQNPRIIIMSQNNVDIDRYFIQKDVGYIAQIDKRFGWAKATPEPIPEPQVEEVTVEAVVPEEVVEEVVEEETVFEEIEVTESEESEEEVELIVPEFPKNKTYVSKKYQLLNVYDTLEDAEKVQTELREKKTHLVRRFKQENHYGIYLYKK